MKKESQEVLQQFEGNEAKMLQKKKQLKEMSEEWMEMCYKPDRAAPGKS